MTLWRKERRMKTCPFCGDAWVYASVGDYGSGYESKGYRVNCKCGHAWHLVKWHKIKENAIKEWETKLALTERKEE